MPTYNAEKFLDHVLNSILQQSYTNFECLVVNDCSTDSSAKIAQGYSNKDKRFHLVNHKANGGLAAARNTGIRLAKGGLICFLDSDDFFLVDSLKNRLNAIKAFEFPEVVGSYGGSISVQENDFLIPPPQKTNQTKIVDFISAGGNCPFNANQPMLK
ncbi:glycosyltransferase family A protein, partial [Arthrospira platensis SPKY2]